MSVQINLLMIGMVTVLGMPSPVGAQSLAEALASAYENNSTLSAERARQRATDEQVPQALSGWRPTTFIQAQSGVVWLDSGAGDVGANTTKPRSIALEIEQPIYRGGRTIAETRQAEHSVLRGRAELSNIEQDVLLESVTAYMDALREDSIVELRSGNVAFLAKELEATRERLDVGEVTRTDLAQAEARLLGAKADLRRAEADLASSNARFEEVIGDAAGTLTRPEIPDALPETRADTIAAIDTNPIVVAAEFELEEFRYAAEVERSEFRPRLGLVGRAERARDSGFKGSESDSLSAQIQIKVPIYQAGLVSSRTRESTELATQRRHDVVTSRRNAKRNAISAWEDLEASRFSIESILAQISAAKIALEGVRFEERVGSRTLIDILDAEQELLNAQVNLTRSQRDEVVAAYRLLASTGQLSAQTLGLNVQLYDPAIHYDTVRGPF